MSSRVFNSTGILLSAVRLKLNLLENRLFRMPLFNNGQKPTFLNKTFQNVSEPVPQPHGIMIIDSDYRFSGRRFPFVLTTSSRLASRTQFGKLLRGHGGFLIGVVPANFFLHIFTSYVNGNTRMVLRR